MPQVRGGSRDGSLPPTRTAFVHTFRRVSRMDAELQFAPLAHWSADRLLQRARTLAGSEDQAYRCYEEVGDCAERSCRWWLHCGRQRGDQDQRDTQGRDDEADAGWDQDQG